MCNAASTSHWKVSFLLPGFSSSSASLLAYFVSGSFSFGVDLRSIHMSGTIWI